MVRCGAVRVGCRQTGGIRSPGVDDNDVDANADVTSQKPSPASAGSRTQASGSAVRYWYLQVLVSHPPHPIHGSLHYWDWSVQCKGKGRGFLPG